MRPLLLSLLLLTSVLAIAQNGAKAVAASALKAQALPCGKTNAKTGATCHKNFAAGCGLPRDPKHKGKFLPPNPSFSPGYDAYLAYFKNQVPKVQPKSQGRLTQVDFVSKYRAALKVTPKISKTNHNQVSAAMLKLGEGQYFTIIGYLYYETLSSGGEACNCDIQNSDPGDDYHIGIGFDEDLAGTAPTAAHGSDEMKQLQKNSIVVEMTPHYRAKYHNGKWTEDKLRDALGKPVKVVGQLLLDNDHMDAASVCSNPKATSKCWRLSAWELHPVTEFYVCRNDKCDENSPTADWEPLDTFNKH